MNTAIFVAVGWFALALFGTLMFMVGASLGHRRGVEDSRSDMTTVLPRHPER